MCERRVVWLQTVGKKATSYIIEGDVKASSLQGVCARRQSLGGSRYVFHLNASPFLKPVGPALSCVFLSSVSPRSCSVYEKRPKTDEETDAKLIKHF